MPEKLGQLVRGGGEVDLVAGLENKVAGGNDGLPFSADGADQHPDPQAFIKIHQPHAVESGVLRYAVLHQLQPPFGEGLHLHGRRKAEHPGDLPGSGPLRVDGHGESQLLPHKAQLLLILRVADAGDGVRNPHLLGHKAGQNVDLIAGGGGDQQIRPAALRLQLYLIAGPVAAHAHDVVDVDDVLNQLGVLVDDRDLVLRGELSCQLQAHLAGAHNNNPHAVLQRRRAPPARL